LQAQARVPQIRYHTWILLVIGAFTLVYLLSLTFVYVEPDHADTIAFHLLGRNPELYSPYSAYHGMMDVVLSVLPPNEPLLRISTILITSVAAVGTLLLMLHLVFQWIGNLPPNHKLVITGIVILAIPELFYFGLGFSPTMIAMSFILLAHLLLRHIWYKAATHDTLFNNRKAFLIASSILFFGLGVSFRWPTAAYGAVIVTDLLLHGKVPGTHANSVRSSLIFAAVWGVFALLAAVLAVAASGYGPVEMVKLTLFKIYDISHLTGNTERVLPTINLQTMITLLSLLTPASVTLAGIGFVNILKKRSSLALLTVVGLLTVLPWIPSGVPKFLITFIPVLVLCVSVGAVVIWYEIKPTRMRSLLRLLTVVGLIFPWVVGFRVLREETAWGPGFERRPYDFGETEGLSIRPTFGPGVGLSTPEGVRPLFGHMYVLGGHWRKFHLTNNEDLVVISNAISDDLPVLFTRFSPANFINYAVPRGYITTDPKNRVLPGYDYFVERRFKNGEGQQLTLFYHEIDGDVTPDDVQQIANLPVNEVIISGYPRTIRHLYQLAPNSLERIGARSAILDVELLRSTLKE